MLNSLLFLQLYILYMSESSSLQEVTKNKRSKYKKISQKIRQQVIQRLYIKKQGLRQVANSLNINHSTCKAILKVYQTEGRIGKKKTRNRNVNVIETFTFCVIDKSNIQEIPQIKIFQSKINCERNEDLNELLKQNAKQKGQQLAQQIVTARKKVNELLWNQNNEWPLIENYGYPQIYCPNKLPGYPFHY